MSSKRKMIEAQKKEEGGEEDEEEKMEGSLQVITINMEDLKQEEEEMEEMEVEDSQDSNQVRFINWLTHWLAKFCTYPPTS